jgi:hypothetical protein
VILPVLFAVSLYIRMYMKCEYAKSQTIPLQTSVRVMLLVNHAMVLIYKVHVPLKRARNFQLGFHQCRLACKTFLRLHSCNSLFSSRLAHSKTLTRRTFNVIPTFVKAEVSDENI